MGKYEQSINKNIISNAILVLFLGKFNTQLWLLLMQFYRFNLDIIKLLLREKFYVDYRPSYSTFKDQFKKIFKAKINCY